MMDFLVLTVVLACVAAALVTSWLEATREDWHTIAARLWLGLALCCAGLLAGFAIMPA